MEGEGPKFECVSGTQCPDGGEVEATPGGEQCEP